LAQTEVRQGARTLTDIRIKDSFPFDAPRWQCSGYVFLNFPLQNLHRRFIGPSPAFNVQNSISSPGTKIVDQSFGEE